MNSVTTTNSLPKPKRLNTSPQGSTQPESDQWFPGTWKRQYDYIQCVGVEDPKLSSHIDTLLYRPQ